MRKILRIAALTLALCAPAFADDGDIPTPPAPPPHPNSIMIVEDAASSGSDAEAAGGITGAALYLLESVLALF